MPVTTESPSAPSSTVGANVCPPPLRRMPCASLTGTGALNDRRMGRIGRQAAWAFSRSQPKSALKGWRTVKSKRFSTLLATPLSVATPLPNTSCILLPAVSRRVQASVA